MSHFPSTPTPMPFATPDVSGDANSTAAVIAEQRPYAYPDPTRGVVDAMMIDAIRASVGPYVPAPWRLPAPSLARTSEATAADSATPVVSETSSTVEQAPSATGERDALPWIDSFLDVAGEAEPISDPAPVRFAVAAPPTPIFSAAAEPTPDVVDDTPAMFAPTPIEASIEAPAAESAEVSADASHDEVQAVDATDAALTADDDASDEWPLADAGAMMGAIAAELSSLSPSPDAAATHESMSASTDESTDDRADAHHVDSSSHAAPLMEPMAAWTDDDIMDIMPVRPADTPSPTNDHWAVQARREADGATGTEAAAAVLEGLARRVRDGELVLPGYSADMGDAATLAAALAALLGVRP